MYNVTFSTALEITPLNVIRAQSRELVSVFLPATQDKSRQILGSFCAGLMPLMRAKSVAEKDIISFMKLLLGRAVEKGKARDWIALITPGAKKLH